MSMNEQMTEMRNRTVEQMKTVQTQVADINERIAGTVVAALPPFAAPLAQRLPKPTELIAGYYDFVGEVSAANRQFAERVVKAWERQPAEPAKTTKTNATKATASKTTASKATKTTSTKTSATKAKASKAAK